MPKNERFFDSVFRLATQQFFVACDFRHCVVWFHLLGFSAGGAVESVAILFQALEAIEKSVH